MRVPTFKRFTSTTFASLAIVAGVLTAVSVFVAVQLPVRLNSHNYLFPHFFDGRFRLFWINAQERPIRIHTQPGSQNFSIGIDEEGSRRRFMVTIGNQRSVPDFGGAWRYKQLTRDGRVPLASVNYFRIPGWLLVIVLLLPPIHFIVTHPWLVRWRERRNRCTSCGYSLVALTQPRCPECGYDVSPHVIENCRGCGYDLTGNVSGACPECGLSLAGV